MTARVLVAMTVRDPAEADALEELARRHDARLAYLQIADPSLSAVLSAVQDEGHREVRLVGIALGSVAPAASWLRRVAAHWWREQDDPPRLEVAPRLLRGLDVDGDVFDFSGRPVTGREAGMTSPAWEDLPEYQRMVFVCRGPRCTARGADEASRALIQHLDAHGLYDQGVSVVQTGCMIPCNQAPVVVIQPDDIWCRAVDAEAAITLVDDYLLDGKQ